MQTISSDHTAAAFDGQLVIDPVCEQVVDARRTEHSRTYRTKRYFFCCDMCVTAFDRSPARYAEARSRGPYF
jgi:YHS domain-containing protein